MNLRDKSKQFTLNNDITMTTMQLIVCWIGLLVVLVVGIGNTFHVKWIVKNTLPLVMGGGVVNYNCCCLR
jgi:hypothetical protein